MLDTNDPTVQKTCYVILETFIAGRPAQLRAMILAMLIAAADYVISVSNDP
jgi:hypothetical protein